MPYTIFVSGGVRADKVESSLLRFLPTKSQIQQYFVKFESEQSELSRLRKEQAKTLHDEVFGGLSPAERAAYNRKQDRIRELECQLFGGDWQLGKFDRGPSY
jgi:hypothetical protein